MPELPEVQTTVDGINKYVKGKTITSVWTNYGGKIHVGKENIKDPSFFKNFVKKITGKKILNATRRAKNILIHLADNHTILVHMKMTGHMMHGKYVFNKEWLPTENGPLKDPFNKFIRLAFTLSDGKHLVLSDMRKFAKVTLIETDKLDQSDHLKNIGPEPLESGFTFKLFKERLLKRKTGRIKNVLMDPTIIAGVGNIYSDEALWLAGIHPETSVCNINDEKLKQLFSAVKRVLRKGIDFGGDSMSDYRNILGERGDFQNQHNAYRKTGKRCGKNNCKGIVQRKIVGGRSAHFCSEHQVFI